MTYILFARRVDASSLKSEEVAAIEKQALKMLVRNETELGNDMDDDKRHMMFELLRSQLIAMKLQDHRATSQKNQITEA